MPRRKNVLLKIWNLITSVLAHIFALILGAAMATGQIGLTGISWLAWLQPAVVPVGWIIIVLTLASALITFIEFFVNLKK